MNRIDSYLSPKCEVRESRIGEYGVFAKEMLVAYELVAVFGGKIYSHQEIEDLALVYPRFATHPVSVHPQFSLGPADPNAACDDTERFNHSCDPNIGIQGQIVLLARRDIAADEELCFDYDTTEIAPPPSFTSPVVVERRDAVALSMEANGVIRNSNVEIKAGFPGMFWNTFAEPTADPIFRHINPSEIVAGRFRVERTF